MWPCYSKKIITIIINNAIRVNNKECCPGLKKKKKKKTN